MHVEKRDEDGDLLVRDVLVAVFFCQSPFARLAPSFGEVFERWFARTPDDGKRWACVGPDAEEYKPVNARILTAARDQLSAAKAKRRDTCALEIGGPENVNPAHQFLFEGSNDLEDDETNVLELRFPSSAAGPSEVEATVAFLREVAECLPYDSGYASLALTYGYDSQESDFGAKARPLAFRHPGFDLPNSLGTNSSVAKKLRGAYWLTFVGPSALKRLGGADALRKQLDADTQPVVLSRGVMLRVSQLPEVGDTNRGKNLPQLRALAKVLEPVTLFGDPYLNVMFPDEHARERWERRHLH